MMRFWRTLAGDAGLDPADRVTTLEQVDELLRHQPNAALAGSPA